MFLFVIVILDVYRLCAEGEYEHGAAIAVFNLQIKIAIDVLKGGARKRGESTLARVFSLIGTLDPQVPSLIGTLAQSNVVFDVDNVEA